MCAIYIYRACNFVNLSIDSANKTFIRIQNFKNILLIFSVYINVLRFCFTRMQNLRYCFFRIQYYRDVEDIRMHNVYKCIDAYRYSSRNIFYADDAYKFALSAKQWLWRFMVTNLSFLITELKEFWWFRNINI